MTKYSLDFKVEVIKACLSGTEGTRSVAKRFDVNRTALRRWVAAYNAHGLDGLKARHQPYSIDFKHQVVQSIRNGSMTVNAALAHYNIPSNVTLLTWVRLYNEGGINALQNKPRGRPKMSKQSKPHPVPEKPLEEMTREELLEELEYRRAEVAYLKKLDALIQSRKLAAKSKRGS